MYGWLLLKALILGIVEGLTEFLPISSTGHLILIGSLLSFNDERGKLFAVVIQTGAMFAIVWEYRERFLRLAQVLRGEPEQVRFALRLALGFLPAAVLGFLFSKSIKAVLFKPIPVATAFVLGALVIFYVEQRASRSAATADVPPRVNSVSELTALDALKVGFCQALALVPGTSRSGATIIGGMLFGLSRKAATEFSFFLAVPTLLAAGAYDLLKHRDLLTASDIPLFSVGSLSAFGAAFLCVRWLLRYVSQHDFRIFAWYRIAFGVLIVLTDVLGWVNWSDG